MKMGDSCCGEISFDSTKSICCGGEVFDKTLGLCELKNILTIKF